jgi:probable F420-dependent oxidoreductase
MHVGTVFSQADSGIDADAIRRWALRAEAAGFHHLMAYDHILGATLEKLGPGPFGIFPTPAYTIDHTFHELLTLFSHLAGVTSTIEFVSSVIVVPQRQAPLVAKQIATVDRLSNQRLHVAMGVGWNRDEYEALGVDFSQRTAIVEEQFEVIRRLLTEPVVHFEGRFHVLDGVGINPLPDRRIPLWMGSGAAEPVLQRVARVADGWMPLLIAGMDELAMGDSVRRLHQICEDNGRDPSTMPIWGKLYIDGTDSWKPEAATAAELDYDYLTVGFNRVAIPDRTHDEHLDLVIDTIDDIKAFIGQPPHTERP